MTKIDEKWLAEAQAVCDAATPGPWTAQMGEFGDTRLHGLVASDGADIVSIDDSGCYYAGETGGLSMKGADAAFIALARTALPEALAELRRLRTIARGLAERDFLGAGYSRCPLCRVMLPAHDPTCPHDRAVRHFMQQAVAKVKP